MSAAVADTISVTKVIDDGEVTAYQVAAIVLCSLVAFLEGLDSQSIAVGAPLIVEKLQLARSALGPIFSAALLGGTVGALTFGPLGDRFGRKGLLVLAALVFGVFTLLTAHAASYESLIVTRFIAGIGLGGAAPCFISLASEYAPKRRRAMTASLIWAAFPLGGIVGGFLNAFILANYGWEAMFYVGGVLPILVAAALLIWLPESLRFLLARGAAPERVGAILARIRPGIPAAARYVADEEKLHGAPLKHLFTEGRAVVTVLLWIPFFTAFAILAISVLWMPTLLREHGIGPAQAAVVISTHGMGALIGMASAGRLIERFGSVPVLLPALLLGAVATAALGYAASSLTAITVTLVFAGLFVGVGASGSIALATLIYPTAIRSSGLGWAMGMGRLGQVLTPLAAAVMAGAGWNGQQLFLAFGAAPVFGAVAVVVLHVHESRNPQVAPA